MLTTSMPGNTISFLLVFATAFQSYDAVNFLLGSLLGLSRYFYDEEFRENSDYAFEKLFGGESQE